ncbi:MAG: hypothetical protein IJJ13_00455 [Lachnospiraceae bacterium]|nr:hypothetical protein [Lachnospiraceae bacterium]
MKSLKLKNGEVIQFSDASSIHNLVGVYQTYGEVDGVRAQLTVENLSSCELDEEKFTRIIPVGVSASSDMEGNVTASFATRDMTDIEKIQERLDVHEDEITEIQDVLVED